jgi:hypothetical protein
VIRRLYAHEMVLTCSPDRSCDPVFGQFPIKRLIGSSNALSEMSGSESCGPDPRITYAAELSAASAPTFTEYPVERFGEEARDAVSGCG